jgi:fatty-acyl-CoA synthase
MTSFSIDLTSPILSLDEPRTDESRIQASRAIDANLRTPRDGVSYVSGEKFRSLSRLTVWQLLERTTKRFPSNEAAVFCEHNIRWTWTQLRDRSEQLAASMLALGIGAGDRVGIWAPNSPEWILTQFATARIGAVLVTINPAYRTSELRHALQLSGCCCLILAARHKSSNYVDMMMQVAPELKHQERASGVVLKALPKLRHLVRLGSEPSPGMYNFSELLKLAGPAQHSRLGSVASRLDPDDAINVQFTSGTTGLPKGATLSHFNIVNNARFTAGAMHLGATDKLCIPVPLYHCFGMVMGVLGCTAVGAAMIFPSRAFEAERTLAALERESCTALYGVPTMFMAMLEHPSFSDRNLTSLRTGAMGGAPCPIDTMRQVMDEMHMPQVTIAYGMTETSPVAFQSDVADPIHKRVATVGRIHPHLEVKIIDADGQIAPVGIQGELCTRGYSVMLGYWNDASRTAEVKDAAGWLHTGDLGVIDEDGYCAIVGRLGDMIIRGGENIYPREIEEFLLTHQHVSDVQVFGVPDSVLGEEVCAFVLLKPGANVSADELSNFCGGQIAHFKIPRRWRFPDALPMTVTGKPQKHVMRQIMVDELR